MVALKEGQCGWVRVYLVDELVVMVAKNYLFTCTVSSPWESLSINFTVHEDRTRQPQVCSAEILSPPPTSQPKPASQPKPEMVDFQTPTPAPSNDGKQNGSYTAIIAGAVAVAVVIVIAVGTICILVCVWRRRRRAGMKMYKLPENDESFVEPNPAFLGPPSLVNSHTNAHQLPNGHSLHQSIHDGVRISRQMAKVHAHPHPHPHTPPPSLLPINAVYIEPPGVSVAVSL